MPRPGLDSRRLGMCDMQGKEEREKAMDPDVLLGVFASMYLCPAGARGWVKRARGSCFIVSYSHKEIGVSLCPNSDSFRACCCS